MVIWFFRETTLMPFTLQAISKGRTWRDVFNAR
jgi:hypothetical protein